MSESFLRNLQWFKRKSQAHATLRYAVISQLNAAFYDEKESGLEDILGTSSRT
jgi:hypothetical protein